MPHDDLPVLLFGSAEEWETWLAANHDGSAGVWLKLAKKGSGARSVSYSDALDVALCYGWIDSQKGRLGDSYSIQRFTPRNPRGRWSKINTERAARLIEAGRMRPAGLREVERAKADGRWDDAYAPQSQSTVPADLAEALAANDRARAFFETLNSVNRYAILYRIGSAKRPETRANRIAMFVAMLSEHKTLYP